MGGNLHFEWLRGTQINQGVEIVQPSWRSKCLGAETDHAKADRVGVQARIESVGYRDILSRRRSGGLIFKIDVIRNHILSRNPLSGASATGWPNFIVWIAWFPDVCVAAGVGVAAAVCAARGIHMDFIMGWRVGRRTCQGGFSALDNVTSASRKLGQCDLVIVQTCAAGHCGCHVQGDGDIRGDQKIDRQI